MFSESTNDLILLQDGIYAATGSGMEFTSNSGASWENRSNGILGFTVNELAATDFAGTHIFAGTSYGIYKTDDLGNQWSFVTLADTAVGTIVAKNSTTLFACTNYGIHRSTDGGVSWQITGGPGNINNHLLVFGNDIYCSVYGLGVYRSTDDGDTWVAMNAGLETLLVTGFGSDGTNLFVGTGYNNAYVSTDGGANWNLINTGLTHSNVLALTAMNDKIFAGTWFNGAAVTADNGDTWDRINSGLPLTTLESSWDFVTTFTQKGTKLFAGVADGVYFTSNDGADWTNASVGLVEGNNIFSSVLSGNGTDLYIGTLDGIYKSSNEGGSWSQVGLVGNYVYSLMASGTDLFAGAADGVYRSSDNGSNWQLMNTGLPFFFQVYSLLKVGNRIYAGSSLPNGVYVSTDNGNSWTPANNGISDACAVTAMAVNGTTLIAATGNPVNGFGCPNYQGVFVSEDFGANWTNINQGLENYNVRAMTIGSTDVFVGTYDGGVWKRPLNQLSSASLTEFNTNENLEVYPNPVNDELTIVSKFTGKAVAEFVNSVGQVIKTVKLEGSENTLNVEELSAGVYLLKLTTEAGVTIGKFVKN